MLLNSLILFDLFHLYGNICHIRNTSNTNNIMTKVIAVSNHKGGVGKTTSVVNIGAGLALKRKKVLLIDADPQANLSQCLGLTESEYTLYGSMIGKHGLVPLKYNNYIDIIQSTLDLAGLEVEIASVIAREKKLKALIDPIKSNYDFVIIDCPPSLGLITINAFTAADEVYIPLQAQFLALHGLDKLIEVIEIVRENLNSNLRIGGVFTTQYDKRKILNRDIADAISNTFPGKVFKTKIRENIALAEAPSQSQDIFTYNKRCYGAIDYSNIVKEILALQHK